LTENLNRIVNHNTNPNPNSNLNKGQDVSSISPSKIDLQYREGTPAVKKTAVSIVSQPEVPSDNRGGREGEREEMREEPKQRIVTFVDNTDAKSTPDSNPNPRRGTPHHSKNDHFFSDPNPNSTPNLIPDRSRNSNIVNRESAPHHSKDDHFFPAPAPDLNPNPNSNPDRNRNSNIVSKSDNGYIPGTSVLYGGIDEDSFRDSSAQKNVRGTYDQEINSYSSTYGSFPSSNPNPNPNPNSNPNGSFIDSKGDSNQYVIDNNSDRSHKKRQYNGRISGAEDYEHYDDDDAGYEQG
jgi:hypothetical protein